VVNLRPIHERSYSQEEFKQYLRDHLVRPSDMFIAAQEFSAVGGGNQQMVQFNLRGSDWDEVGASADKVMEAMRAHGGFVDIDTTYRTGKPEIGVVLDRERAAALGIPAAAVGQTLRAFLGGDKVTEYREGGKTYDVRIRLPDH